MNKQGTTGSASLNLYTFPNKLYNNSEEIWSHRHREREREINRGT